MTAAPAVTELVESDAAAFCRRVYPRLVGALGLHCGDAAVGEELAQEALVRLWQRWPKVLGLDSPETWVFRVGFNLANSRFRRVRVERRVVAAASSADAGADATDAIAVRVAVRALPERQREALVLRYFMDLSVAETAQVMGCAAGTVKALTSQAVAGLRTRLGVDIASEEGGERRG